MRLRWVVHQAVRPRGLRRGWQSLCGLIGLSSLEVDGPATGQATCRNCARLKSVGGSRIMGQEASVTKTKTPKKTKAKPKRNLVDEAKDIQDAAHILAKRAAKLVDHIAKNGADVDHVQFLRENVVEPIENAAVGCDDLIRALE